MQTQRSTPTMLQSVITRPTDLAKPFVLQRRLLHAMIGCIVVSICKTSTNIITVDISSASKCPEKERQHHSTNDTASTFSLMRTIRCLAPMCRSSASMRVRFKMWDLNAYALMSTMERTTPCTRASSSSVFNARGMENAPIP